MREVVVRECLETYKLWESTDAGKDKIGALKRIEDRDLRFFGLKILRNLRRG